MYDIFFDLDNMHQPVDEADETFAYGYYALPDNDEEQEELFIDDDYPVIVERSKNGLFCKKCGELFPYAESNQKDGTLICYSCKNYG